MTIMTQSISPLRQRTIDDMRMRKLTPTGYPTRSPPPARSRAKRCNRPLPLPFRNDKEQLSER